MSTYEIFLQILNPIQILSSKYLMSFSRLSSLMKYIEALTDAVCNVPITYYHKLYFKTNFQCSCNNSLAKMHAKQHRQTAEPSLERKIRVFAPLNSQSHICKF